MNLTDDKLVEYLLNSHRVQRHDFLNYLQVISGYIQLGKPEKAKGFLDSTVEKMIGMGRITRLNYPSLVAVILNLLSQLGLEAEGVILNINTQMPNYKGNDKFIAHIIEEFWQSCLKDIELGKCIFELEIIEKENNYIIMMNAKLIENQNIISLGKILADRLSEANIFHNFYIKDGEVHLDVYLA